MASYKSRSFSLRTNWVSHSLHYWIRIIGRRSGFLGIQNWGNHISNIRQGTMNRLLLFSKVTTNWRLLQLLLPLIELINSPSHGSLFLFNSWCLRICKWIVHLNTILFHGQSLMISLTKRFSCIVSWISMRIDQISHILVLVFTNCFVCNMAWSPVWIWLVKNAMVSCFFLESILPFTRVHFAKLEWVWEA